MNDCAYLLVNFGGPRTKSEIYPFLTSLLTDKEVVRTSLPSVMHNYLFRKVAKKRAKKVEAEYQKIGGASPIFEDTESIKNILEKEWNSEVITYHRYLPMTHQDTFTALENVEAEHIIVFPFFPQFSYATTGSAAKQMKKHLSKKTEQKLIWVKSYAHHSDFISLFVSRIQQILQKIVPEEAILIFSAHGLPQRFVDEGDPYFFECIQSFKKITAYFPQVLCRLAFQSKFGPEEWLRPYTEDVCKEMVTWGQNRKHVIFVPLSFTSDHIETLVEIEEQYMPIITKAGLKAYRVECFNRAEDWIYVIKNIVSNFLPVTTKMLVRWERS